MKLKKLWVFFCFFSMMFISQVYAETFEPFVVKNINIVGLKRVSLGAAFIHLPIKKGDTVDSQSLAYAIRSLYASNSFESIEAKSVDNVLIFHVKERPAISSIVFEGNDAMSEDQLKEILASANIKEGDGLDRTKIREIEKGLEEFYFSQGKYNTKVRIQVVDLERNRVELVFDFIESDAAQIVQINFTGNDTFSDEVLLDEIKLRDDVPWWNFLSDQQYQKQKLEADIETISTFYRNRGYIRFKVESTQVSISRDNESLYVTLNLNEGAQYKVKEVKILGDLLDKRSEIEKLSKIKLGEQYNAADVTQTEERIRRYLGTFGYAYPEVKSVSDVHDHDKTVILNLMVNSGPRVYVRHINFVGNTATKDEVLRREMRQFEGAWLNKDKVNLSKLRLERLGFFAKVDVEIARLPGIDDQVDVNYTVEEKSTGEFKAGLSYSNQSGFMYQFNVQQRNLFGLGNYLGLQLSRSDALSSVSTTYRNPYFTHSGVSLGGNAFWSSYDAKEDKLFDYKKDTYGFSIDSGFPLSEVTRINFDVSYEYQDISQNSEYEQAKRFYAVYGKNHGERIHFDEYALGVTWTFNSLNRYSFPTQGHEHIIGGKVTIPGSGLQYFDTRYKARHFFPLDDDHKWVFSLKNLFKYSNSYGRKGDHDHILPFWVYHTAGGATIMRGFESNSVGPRAYTVEDKVTTCGGHMCPAGPQTVTVSDNGIGGNALVYLSSELIFPIPFVKDKHQQNLRTALFVDIGNVWDTEFSYTGIPEAERSKLPDYSDPWRYRASAGLSVQWLSPLGLLSFNIAKVLKKQDGDDERFFDFMIGTSF